MSCKDTGNRDGGFTCCKGMLDSKQLYNGENPTEICAANTTIRMVSTIHEWGITTEDNYLVSGGDSSEGGHLPWLRYATVRNRLYYPPNGPSSQAKARDDAANIPLRDDMPDTEALTADDTLAMKGADDV